MNIGMTCLEKDCCGMVEAKNFISTQRGGCSVSKMLHFCSRCGALHRWRKSHESLFADFLEKVFSKKLRLCWDKAKQKFFYKDEMGREVVPIQES